MADKDTPPKLPEFQCRVFGYNPVPRCARPAAPTPQPEFKKWRRRPAGSASGSV